MRIAIGHAFGVTTRKLQPFNYHQHGVYKDFMEYKHHSRILPLCEDFGVSFLLFS